MEARMNVDNLGSALSMNVLNRIQANGHDHAE